MRLRVFRGSLPHSSHMTKTPVHNDFYPLSSHCRIPDQRTAATSFPTSRNIVAQRITHTGLPQHDAPLSTSSDFSELSPELQDSQGKETNHFSRFCDLEHLEQEERKSSDTETPTIPHTNHRCQTNKCQTNSSTSSSKETRGARRAMAQKRFRQGEACRRIRACQRRVIHRRRSTRSHFTLPKGFTSGASPLTRTPSFLIHKGIRAPEISMRIPLPRGDCSRSASSPPSSTVSAFTVRRVGTRQVSPNLRFAASIIATGVIAGLVGRACTLLLHGVEMIVWNRHEDTLLHAVEATAPLYRLVILVLAGLAGAASWTLMFRRSRQLVSVSAAVSGERMLPLRTLWHASTQIILVAMGASIGREVAPRELSAAFCARVCERLGLDAEDRRIIVACGAGAGLAAVYSIPLSGAVYTLEILLATMRARTVAPAFATSALAVLVSSGWNRPEPFDTVSELHASASLTCWALLFGPFLAWLGVAFRRCVHIFEDAKPRNLSLWWTLPLAFSGVGIVSIFITSVVKNG